MRVCTDCHFSLQTVTVASSSALQVSGTANGDGQRGDGGSGEVVDVDVDDHDHDDENTVNDDNVNDNGDGAGDDDDDGESLLLRGIGGDVGLGVGGGGSCGGSGTGRGFVERLEAVYLTDEIAGDVVLEDVLEWDRIQVCVCVWTRVDATKTAHHVACRCLVCASLFVCCLIDRLLQRFCRVFRMTTCSKEGEGEGENERRIEMSATYYTYVRTDSHSFAA